MDSAPETDLADTLSSLTADDYRWRGVRPFYEQPDAEGAVEAFFAPFRSAFSALHRREDIFIAGANNAADGGDIWTMSMGHFVGLFDGEWLGVAPTGRLMPVRYAEFDRVVDGKVAESALFLDVIGVMQRAGCDPLPAQTGAQHWHPGPRTRDGVLLEGQDPAEGMATLALVNRMIDDLQHLNVTGNDQCPPEYLAKTWQDDMAWYGPAGIGSVKTIRRYQKHHQYPFRTQLTDKKFLGHVTRIAEGNYCGFFGWPNLTNRSTGGFLGLPASATESEMRIVDVYRREGDRLAENWVLIDLPHYLALQGLDVLKRQFELSP
ncbi:MAG: ester cyclase [Pseudomonadota bacterium]